MTSLKNLLDDKYQEIVKHFDDRDFLNFYNSIYEYVNLIEKQPELLSIVDTERKEFDESLEKIETNADISKWDKKGLIQKMEKFSISYYYDDARDRIYTPIKEYRQLLEPVTRKNTRGYALAHGEECPPFIFYLIDIPILLILRDKIELDFSYYRFLYRMVMSSYMKKIWKLHKGIESKMAEIKAVQKVDYVIPENFFFNPETGEFKYNLTEGVLSPKSREFEFLKVLYLSPTHQATHAELGAGSKLGKINMTETIKILKRKLGILPKNTHSNPNIFKSLSKYGYKLEI